MKKLLFPAVLCLSLFSCTNDKAKTETTGSDISADAKSELHKKVTARDYSITAANAYNDIFLDSAALEKFIAETQLGDSITRRMRSFYNARNYQYAWFSSNGVTEQARGFWNLQSYYNGSHKDTGANYKTLSGLMDRLTTDEDLKVSTGDQGILKAEFLLTQNFIKYVLENYEDGIVKRKELERFIPLKKTDALQVADSLLNKKHKDNKYYEDDNPAYGSLKTQLQKYVAIAKAGGWQAIPDSKTGYKIGISAPAVLTIKKRLSATGELSGDTTAVFDAQLEAAVKTFQSSLGLTADGVVSPALIKDLNVPVQQRIQQILINMDRMRWMPEPKEGNLIIVNIPEFDLKVFEGNQKAFNMGVVVGKEGHNTMMFKGDLSTVVFSPYWDVPPNIVRAEILPAMQRNPNYLASKHMEQTGTSGGLPVIRQLPGEDNSLGKVKFLFPNSFNIYFHDTPAKSLFSKDKRAYSHGCIRLSDPVHLAQYVLRNQPEWTPEKIADAMNSGHQQFVALKKKIPVIITYYTAWVGDNGVLNFRDDIYGHDAELAKKMFF